MIKVASTELKGHLISKCLSGIFNSLKKCTKKFNFISMLPKACIVFVHFFGKLKTPERHSEIKWPLDSGVYICTMGLGYDGVF